MSTKKGSQAMRHEYAGRGGRLWLSGEDAESVSRAMALYQAQWAAMDAVLNHLEHGLDSNPEQWNPGGADGYVGDGIGAGELRAVFWGAWVDVRAYIERKMEQLEARNQELFALIDPERGPQTPPEPDTEGTPAPRVLRPIPPRLPQREPPRRR